MYYLCGMREVQTHEVHSPPLVSIVMPFKNTAAYLPDCINSIIDQRFTHWELIAVNDGSEDESYEVVQRFAKEDARITVLHNNGKGIVQALQTAYALTKGHYITRMDSDDRMAPEKLGKLYELLQQHGRGTVATALVEYFADFPIGDGYRVYQNWLNKLSHEGTHFKAIYKECVIASPCWMIHREDFEACGAFGPEVYPEDYELVFRFYEAGFKVAAVPEVLHHWRDYPHRTSRTHPNYADQRFFDVKLDYFFRLDRDPSRPLLLWGAGKKGKQLAKLLKQQQRDFVWMCNNPKKIGLEVADILMHDYKTTDQYENPQILIAIAGAAQQELITWELNQLGLEHNKNFFFFC